MRHWRKVLRDKEREVAAKAAAQEIARSLALAELTALESNPLFRPLVDDTGGWVKVGAHARHTHKAGLGLREGGRRLKGRDDRGVDPSVIGGPAADDFAQFQPQARRADLSARIDSDAEPSRGRRPVRDDWDWNARSHTRTKPTTE